MRNPTRIRSFTDACEAVLALQERDDPAHVVACLGAGGGVVDRTPFVGGADAVADAAGWAHCLLSNRPDIASVVLLSAGQDSVTEVRERDVALFRRLQSSFEDRGIPVHDWIMCDGDNLRSMAITAGGDQRWPEPAAA